MERRTLLSSVSIAAVSAGCLSNPAELLRTEPTASKRKKTENVSATVVEQANYKPYREGEPSPPRDENGQYQNTVSGTFDCTAKTATLEGWLSTSSCRTVAIQSLEYNEEADRITLGLFPKWSHSQPPSEIDCSGAGYKYRIKLEAKTELPAKIRVVYRWPDRDENQFSVENGDC